MCCLRRFGNIRQIRSPDRLTRTAGRRLRPSASSGRSRRGVSLRSLARMPPRMGLSACCALSAFVSAVLPLCRLTWAAPHAVMPIFPSQYSTTMTSLVVQGTFCDIPAVLFVCDEEESSFVSSQFLTDFSALHTVVDNGFVTCVGPVVVPTLAGRCVCLACFTLVLTIFQIRISMGLARA